MTVLERDAFLDSLLEYAGEAAAGASRLVFLAGEAGVGKTTLLELLRQKLPEARWVGGACDGSFTPEPLGPLFDIAPRLGGALASACDEGAPRDRLFRLVLDALAPPAPFTVVVIEDAHWTDEATADLIRFLGRRMGDSRTLLLVSYRDEGLGAKHPLRLTLGDLASERSLRRMTLPPLSPVAVRELAAGTGIESDDLYALTGGNPFFVNEVLGIKEAALPVSARDAVLARVARLSPAARATLDAVAVLAEGDPALVAAVAESSEGVDECVDNGVLVSEATGGVRFRHELARLAVADAIAPHRRRELHARALAALRTHPDVDLARAAHHAEEALDAAAVLDYAVRAGERASSLSAHREAAAQYSRALRFATDRPIAERADLHDRLATEQLIIEDWQQSDLERERAVELWRQVGDPARLGDSLRQLGRTRLRMFNPAGMELLDESIEILEALPPSRALAWAFSHKAASNMYEDPPLAIEYAQRARKVLEESGVDDAGLISDSLNSEASAHLAMGEPTIELMERALQIALEGDAVEAATRAYNNLGATYHSLSSFEAALRCAEEGIPYCEDHDQAMYAHCLMGSYVAILERLGRWDEALDIAERELLKPTLSPFNRAGPCLTAGAIYARRGDWKAAQPLLAESTKVYNDMACNEDDLRRVEISWLEGDTDKARMQAETLAAIPGLAAESTSELAVWLRRVGGNLDDFDLFVDAVRTRQLTEPWQNVAAMWAELDCPYEQALALFDSGEEEPMREAIAILDRLGATAAVNVVRAEMRHRGFTSIPRGSRTTTRADRFGLTSRQREVLTLLSEGLTNADIGTRLFLSERTVDHHVSAVLAKLGVQTRRDAARVADEAGMLTAASS